MVAFAEERINALRREFGMLWLAREGQAALPPSARGPAETFTRRMEATRAKIQQAQRAMAGLQGKGPIEVLTVARQLEGENFGAAMQGLEEQARGLRQQLGMPAARPQAAPAAGTGPLARLAGAGATGPLPRPGTQPLAGGAREGFLGKLKKLGEPPTVEAMPAPAAEAPPAVSRARQAFEAAYELVRGVLEYVTPRLEVVKVALDTTGLPAKKAEWEVVTKTLKPNAVAAGIPEPHMPWLPPLTKLMYQNMSAVQKAHMALVQWGDARRMHAEAEQLTTVIADAPEPRQESMLASFDLGKYRAAVYPISHLHVSFQGLSPLSDFFPAP